MLMGLLCAMVIPHAHHEDHVAPLAHHCGAQCCPAHSSVPIRHSATVLSPQAAESLAAVASILGPHHRFIQAIFRPPIAVALL